jgi:hypothetical protein
MLNDTGAAECRSEDGLCTYCRAAPATTVDHLRPVGAGLCRGKSSLVACCASCNSSKGKREYGLWMVNKFGLSAETLARMCSLEEREGDGAWEGDGPSGRKGGSEEGMTSPEALSQLREVCYAFCADLHDRILRLRGEAGCWKDAEAPGNRNDLAPSPERAGPRRGQGQGLDSQNDPEGRWHPPDCPSPKGEGQSATPLPAPLDCASS